MSKKQQIIPKDNIFSLMPKYEKVSFSELLKVIHWGQTVLNLRDWTIELEVSLHPPQWVEENNGTFVSGCIHYENFNEFGVGIWIQEDENLRNVNPISPNLCENTHPITVLLHELVHLFLRIYGVNRHSEKMVNIITLQLYQNWLRFKELKKEEKNES